MADGRTICVEGGPQLFKIIAPCMVRGPSGKRTFDKDARFEEVPNPFSIHDKVADQVSDLIDRKFIAGFAHDGTMTKTRFD